MSAPYTPSNKLIPSIPTLDAIRAATKDKFGRYPCLWQAQVAQAMLRGNKDIIVKSGTGSGKTLTFWMPLLFSPTGIQVVITPLNLLGSQNEAELRALKIEAIAINGKNITHQKIQDISDGKYRVVIVNPEIALGAGSIFEKVWKCDSFKLRVLSVIWDEAHCVSAWSTFRKEYKEAGRLRLILGRHVPFYAASATLPLEVLTDVMSRLRMQHETTVFIERSNDRPNVYLAVRRIQHALDSFEDLDFLVPKGWTPETPLPKFLVFFDDITESVAAAKRLRSLLPSGFQHLIKWFNSEMTPTFREHTTKEFRDGKNICGLYTTDSFGLGMDVPDISCVYQWRVTCNLNTLWQRFGRAARGPGTEAVAVLFAEAKYFDDEKEKAAKATVARAAKATAKATAREKEKRPLEDASNRSIIKRSRIPDLQAGADKEGQVLFESGMDDNRCCDDDANAGFPLSEPGQLTVYEELRTKYKAQLTKEKISTSTKPDGIGSSPSAEVKPEMDAFINAATRIGHCFRLPVMAYYENDRTTYRVARDVISQSQPLGAPFPSALFTRFLPQPPSMTDSTVKTTSSSGPRANRLPKFTKSFADFRLRDALDAFRRKKMEEQYGHHALNTVNAGAIMGDDILDRIADCAHCHRIRTIEDLKQQVPKWRRAEVYGSEVLILIHRILQLLSIAPIICLNTTSRRHMCKYFKAVAY
ncbi:P-loop containing nucleoside triphosphate hydrolase protein [Irpex rosettiformis]|uniref:P-loop containing nucleoside triphosphate hydrolase protein n=1 Tax=Irpex rosettiformis TaxID=378272 RepID=A0ACB8TS09_9APHY|nr:P-loop containing nucleoside triphosphate hydrolase protein [Irpex rosettiformis]